MKVKEKKTIKKGQDFNGVDTPIDKDKENFTFTSNENGAFMEYFSLVKKLVQAYFSETNIL